MAAVDIWSVPLVEPVASITISRGEEDGWQPKRSSLFLPDSDDEDGGGLPPRETLAPSSKDNDPLAAPEPSKLDAMFGDLDDDDGDAFTVEPTLDTEEMKRQADARVASATRSAAQSVAPSFTSGATADVDTASRDKGKIGKTKKTTTRVLPKLDEERLLGDDGFRRLIEDSKNFKITGKGNEVADLDRLFRLYHGWTHRLFPKYQFKDTVDRVEKLCRSRRMAVNLRGWRDEAHGITLGVRHEVTDVDGENSEHDEGSDGGRRATSAARSLSSPSLSTRPTSPVTRPNSTASMAPSVLSSATEDSTMDIDIEALIREEEEMMREINAGDKGKANYYMPSNPTEHEDEGDGALWAGIPDTGIAQTVSDFHHRNARRDEVEDDDLWDIAAEMEAQPLSAPQGGPEAAGSAVPPAEISTAPTADPSVGGDWDDMYA